MLKMHDLTNAFYSYESPLIIVVDELNNPVGILKKSILIMESARGNIIGDNMKMVIKKCMQKVDYTEILKLLETKNNVIPCVDANGETISTFKLSADEQEEKIPFGIAIQSLPIGIIMCSNLNKIVYINHSAQKIVGRTENEVLGRNVDNIFRDSNILEAFNTAAVVFEIRIGTEASSYVAISKVINRGEKKLGTILILIQIDLIKKIYKELPENEK